MSYLLLDAQGVHWSEALSDVMNTLLIQRVLAEPEQFQRMQPEGLRV